MLKYIYIMEFDIQKKVKIGVSDDPCKRMRIVANQLGVKLNGSRLYISPVQKDPYSIEHKCHESLSNYRINGYGQNNKYKREVFSCDLETAKATLDSVLNECQ